MKQKIQFSLFQALQTKLPPTLITLEEVYRLVTADANLKENTGKYRYFKSQGFEKDADEIKIKKCLAFTPAAVFEQYRRYNCITAITQYSMVDLDGLTEAEAVRFIQLLKDDPYWLLAYITLSGKGLRIIFRVEGVTDQKSYLKAFYQGNAHYCELFGIAHFDDQVKDMTRTSALCHDPNALYREEAKVFPVDYDKVSVTEVWKTTEKELASRGCVYEPGRHNEYISQAGYLLNLYGVEEDEATRWLQHRFPDYDANRTESHIRSCYSTCAHEHGTLKPGTRPKGGKKKTGKRKETGDVKYIGVEEIENMLREQADFRQNEITRFVEIRWKDGDGKYKQLTTRDEGTLWSRINKQKPMKMADMKTVLCSEFIPLIHPFKDYFYALPSWQEGDTDHIGALADTVTLTDESPEMKRVFRQCLQKWMVAMVAGFLSDRVNHEILVLIGPQGIYKTTWFHYLLPPELRSYYVAKTNYRKIEKDDRIQLAEAGLICLEEISTMTDREVEQMKAIVSMPQVVERAVYAPNKEVRPHIASFCGTGNHRNFLTDITGNRRWLPFEVENILSPYDHPLDYTGLYSQLMHLWQSGFPYWFDQAEIRALASHVSRFEADNLEEQQILKHFRIPHPGEAYEVYSVADVLSVINLEMKTLLSPTKVGILMNKLGFKKVRKDNHRGYLVHRYCVDEISSNRKGKVVDGEEQVLPF